MATEHAFEETEDAAPPPAVMMNKGSKLRQRLQKRQEAKAADQAEEGVEPPPDAELAETSKAATSKPLKALHDKEDAATVEWLSSLSSDHGALRVALLRREPKIAPASDGSMIKCDGQLAVYDRPITEEEIQSTHGGGSYQLRVQTKNAKGQWVYATAKSVDIAGAPIVTNLVGARHAPQQTTVVERPDPSAPMVNKLLDYTLNQATRQAPAGPSIAELAVFMRPLEMQLKAAQEQNAALMVQINDARSAGNATDPFRDKMLDSLLAGDSSRLQQLRANHESELRMLRENHRSDEKRLEDRWDRERDAMSRAHDREIATMRSSNDMALAALRQSHDQQKHMLEVENLRLTKANDQLTVEVTKLREKKDPSVKEKFEEVEAFKKMLGADDEPAEKSGFEKAIEMLGQSPAVLTAIERIGNASGGAPTQVVQVPQLTPAQTQAAQQARANKRMRLLRDKRTNLVYATDTETGKTIQVTRKDQIAQQTVTAPDGTVTVIPAEAPPPIPLIPPEDAATAAGFMLNAFQSGTDPVTFAESARPYITKDILTALRRLSVDDFMVKVAQLEGNSPLLTQDGRNWSRKVVRSLLGD